MERFGDTWRFRVSAKPFSGGPVAFEILCHNSELTPEKIQEINESFKNNLRWLKHHGGWPAKGKEDPQQMQKDLGKWSSTDTGLAIKIGDDPVKEFVPFVAK